ncbi:MAG: hypothetical protein IKP92_01605 [Lachnospiraceae bacterium]|nr:hypothetical protein [Lachnospiraceae bacterium]
MSKKLEEEYKSMVASEVPDLWDRIEKSLPEKAPAKGKEAYGETAKPAGKNKKKKPVIVRILPWAGGIAAAAVITLILLPVFLSANKAKNLSTSAEMVNIQGLTDTMKYEGAALEAAESAEEEYLETSDKEANEQPLSTEAEGQKKQAVSGPVRSGEDARNGEDVKKGDEPTGGEKLQEEEAKNYILVIQIDPATGKASVQAASDYEILKNTNPDLQIEVFETVISKDSEVDAKPGKIYIAKFTKDGEAVLLESIE